MFDFFRLKSTMGRSYNTDLGDVFNTKKALNTLGFYNKPDYGMTKYPDRGLFDGIGNYQKSRGLKVDGLMKPNGETARSISADIGRRDEINRRPSIAGQMRNIMARREGISKQDVITGNGGQPLSGSLGSFVPVKPPSRSRVPNPITPIVRAEPTAASSPWWQSSAKVSGEAHASNSRTLDGLLKYSVNGDLPNLFASAIKEAGKPAVAELGNFMAQLDQRAPERTRGFESQVFNKLGNHQKATHFPEVFNRPPPRKPTPPGTTKPADGLDRGAISPEIKGWLEKSFKNSNPGAGQGQTQIPAQEKQPVRPTPIPAYRKQAKGLQGDNWTDWSNSVGKVGNLSPAERRAYMETFAAEGGLNTDQSSGAASGITQDALDRAIKDGALPGVKEGTKPTQLPVDQRAKVYRHYFDDVLHTVDRKIPGSSNLQRIGNGEATSALADTMFAHGRRGGAEAIQNAINKVKPGTVNPDGDMGPKTFDAYRQLTGNPNTNRAILDALGNARWDMVKGRKDAAGWRSRIDHFRFQKSP